MPVLIKPTTGGLSASKHPLLFSVGLHVDRNMDITDAVLYTNLLPRVFGVETAPSMVNGIPVPQYAKFDLSQSPTHTTELLNLKPDDVRMITSFVAKLLHIVDDSGINAGALRVLREHLDVGKPFQTLDSKLVVYNQRFAADFLEKNVPTTFEYWDLMETVKLRSEQSPAFNKQAELLPPAGPMPDCLKQFANGSYADYVTQSALDVWTMYQLFRKYVTHDDTWQQFCR